MASFSTLTSASLLTTSASTLSLGGLKLPLPQYGGNGCTTFYDWNNVDNDVKFGGNSATYSPETPLTPGVNCTYVDVGGGNDRVELTGTTGVFDVVTGYGRDFVNVNNAKYVKIENYDGADAGDSFRFNADFSGKAEIYSFDNNDILEFNCVNTASTRNDWYTTHDAGDTIFHNAHTGGTITVHAADLSMSDTASIAIGLNGYVLYWMPLHIHFV